MDLSSILAKLKEAKELLVTEAPDVLLRISEFAAKVAEVTKEAAEFLKNLDGDLPHPLMQMMKDERESVITEFEEFHKEVKSLANKSPHLMKQAAEKNSLPAATIAPLAKMLATVTTRIHDKIEDHTEED